MKMEFQVKSAAVTDRGLNEKRAVNEDSYLEMPEKGLFVVADGVGGAQAGEVASRMAVEILAEAFENWHEQTDAEELMKTAIEKANEAVYQMAQELPALSTMATTIVALHINGNVATIGHVGDSRLYRLDPNNNLFRETQDHSILEEEIRAGRITPAQAAQHPYRNVISRAVGAEKDVQVDMKTIIIEPNTTFLLCSDGITRHIEDYEIRDILIRNSEPSKACNEFKQICYKRGAEDNLTAIVVKFMSSAVKESFDEQQGSTVTEAVFATRQLNPESVLTAEQSFSETQTIPQANEDQKISEPEEKKQEEITQKIEEAESFGSFAERFASAILLVILGIIAGITLYHFVLKNFLVPSEQSSTVNLVQPPIVISTDIEYASFEDNRRNVDADPAKYIEVSGAKAESAEDFYLLGRAYFLLGNYSKAKEAFDKAKELLKDVKEINRKTLENEIALGLSTVENVIARNEFITQKKSMAAKENKDAETNKTNSNTYNSVNSNLNSMTNSSSTSN